MLERQVVSVVITSMPLLKSIERFFIPGPINSRTLFLTNPFLKVAPTSAIATS